MPITDDWPAKKNFDSLTDLPDSSAWIRRLREKADSIRPLIIISIDIKDLKNINSKFGYQVGNISLIAAADIIKSSLRPDDFVARIGEDDFGVLVDSTFETPSKLLKIIGSRLLDRIMDYNSEHQIPISLDIGGAYSLEPPHDLDGLISHAKKAMYSRRYNKKRSSKFDV